MLRMDGNGFPEAHLENYSEMSFFLNLRIYLIIYPMNLSLTVALIPKFIMNIQKYILTEHDDLKMAV